MADFESILKGSKPALCVEFWYGATQEATQEATQLGQSTIDNGFPLSSLATGIVAMLC